MNMVIVIGSINMDIIFCLIKMLKLGEMMYVYEIFYVGGGKGVN